MEFLSEPQRLLRDAVREFAMREIAPHAAKWDRESSLPDAVIGKLGAMGLLGMNGRQIIESRRHPQAAHASR